MWFVMYFILYVLSVNFIAKPDTSPRPASVSEEQNVVVSTISSSKTILNYLCMLQKKIENCSFFPQIVRKLFPSLSTASRAGLVSPPKNNTTAVHQGTVILLYISLISKILNYVSDSCFIINRCCCLWRGREGRVARFFSVFFESERMCLEAEATRCY